ncbi:NUDIX hydrolase [Ectothiorhodospiraceae bacterium WFHF3C12]|nr:NUDIX hydrolase [Ectothiorhodospiraceae bacterium WFHF3C12]
MPRPETPLLTVDVIIELLERPGEVVFIERRNEPLGLALPGGFVDRGETVTAAAVREAREETGLDVTLEGMLGVYSDPGRDPRGHTASIVFVGRASGEPRAGDDAGGVRVMPPDKAQELVFDHARIIEDYLSTGEVRFEPPFVR